MLIEFDVLFDNVNVLFVSGWQKKKDLLHFCFLSWLKRAERVSNFDFFYHYVPNQHRKKTTIKITKTLHYNSNNLFVILF